MALTNRKFAYPDGWDNPASDFYGKGNYGKPDRPGYTTEEMQKVLDEISRTIIAPRINQIIDDLVAYVDSASGADNIGATPLTGGTAHTVQGIIEELAGGTVPVAKATQADSATELSGYTIQTTLVSSNSAIPTSKAIADAMGSAGNGDMMKSVYDPNNVESNAFSAANQSITDTHSFYTSTNVDGALDELAQKNWYNITISSSNPTGGSNGDIWIKVT